MDQWTQHPAQANRPATWPSLLPFLPDMASRTMESPLGQGAMWTIDSRPMSADEQAEREALGGKMKTGGLADVLGVFQAVLARASAAPSPAHAAALEALTNRLAAAVESAGGTPVPLHPLLARMPGLSSRGYRLGTHLVTINVMPSGPEVGVMVFAGAGTNA